MSSPTKEQKQPIRWAVTHDVGNQYTEGILKLIVASHGPFMVQRSINNEINDYATKLVPQGQPQDPNLGDQSNQTLIKLIRTVLLNNQTVQVDGSCLMHAQPRPYSRMLGRLSPVDQLLEKLGTEWETTYKQIVKLELVIGDDDLSACQSDPAWLNRFVAGIENLRQEMDTVEKVSICIERNEDHRSEWKWVRHVTRVVNQLIVQLTDEEGDQVRANFQAYSKDPNGSIHFDWCE